MKRIFSDTNIAEFNLLLREETLDDILQLEDVNISYEIFYEFFRHYFDRAFPIKLNSMSNKKREKRWVTKGILVSKRKMCFLNRIKRVNSLTPKVPEYINNYQRTLKTVMKEAKKSEFENCVSLAKNKTKTSRQIINKEMGN
jgi:hypothetical protein